jgi:xanthine dehydrogenase accessory factor
MPAMKRVNPLGDPLHLYQSLREGLLRKECLALATVISRSGSGPREPGANMLIRASGETIGTIGGGLLEARVLDLAGVIFQEEHSAVLAMELTSPLGAAGGGMICGGRVEILVEYLDGADSVWPGLLDRILESVKGNCSPFLIRSIQMTGEIIDPTVGSSLSSLSQGKNREKRTWVRTGQGLWEEDRLLAGSLDMAQWNPELLPKKGGRPEATLLEGSPIRYFVQPVDSPVQVVIVGAGHVGQALAMLCHFVGIKTIIIDDRPEFASRERFPTADAIVVPSSLEDCFPDMTITPEHYVVIVTRGHAFDRSVLAQTLRTEAGYVGMIASRTKRDAVYKSLQSEGITPEVIGRVHSPIGLSIGAQTPEEIAVSIIAEIIGERGQKHASAKKSLSRAEVMS